MSRGNERAAAPPGASGEGSRAPGPAPAAPILILLTGVMAAGKSAVAQAVAERLPRSVHLRGDVFRRMVVNGRAEMSAQPSEAALSQLRLRHRIAADAARSYLAAGFSVVYQDIVLGEELRRMVGYHARPLHLVVLCPRADVVARRARERDKPGYRPHVTVADLDRALRDETPRIGLWLDSSDLTVAETADRILARLAEAEVRDAGPAPPPSP